MKKPGCSKPIPEYSDDTDLEDDPKNYVPLIIPGDFMKGHIALRVDKVYKLGFSESQKPE